MNPSSYYILERLSPIGKMYYTLQVGHPENDVTWQKGIMLVPDAEWENERPPAVPIQINIQDETVDKDLFIYRELSWVQIPLMTRRLK